MAVKLCDPNRMTSESTPSKEFARTCKGCCGEMMYLGTLPRSRGKPALPVFRCFTCNNVDSESSSDLYPA